MEKTISMKTKIFSTVGVIALFAIGGISTQALFTDSATTNVTVTSGTLELDIDRPATIALNNIVKPGDTQNVPITVSNNGSLDLNYTVSTSNASGDLGPILDVTAKVGSSTIGTGKLNSFSIPSRSLNSNADETVTLTVSWPTSQSSNALQGKNASTTLTFNATQN